MSETDASENTNGFAPLSYAALLRRIAFYTETLYDLETERRPLTPQLAVRVDRTIEALCACVDELARRCS